MHHKFKYPIIGFTVSLLFLPLISQAAYNWKTSFATATKANEISIGEIVRAVSDTRVNFEGVAAKKAKQLFGDKTTWSFAIHSEVIRQRIDETTYANSTELVFNNASFNTTKYIGKEKNTTDGNFSDIIRLRAISKDGVSYLQVADMSPTVCKWISPFAGPCSSLIGEWIRIEEMPPLENNPFMQISATSVDQEKLLKLSKNEKLKKLPLLQPLRLVKTFTGEDGSTYALIESKISQAYVNAAIAEYKKTITTQNAVVKAEMNEAVRYVNTFVASSRIYTTINTETNAITAVELKGKVSGSFYDIGPIFNKARKIVGAKRVLQGNGKIEIFNTATIERNVSEEIKAPEISKTPEEFFNYLDEAINAAQDTDGDHLYDADELRFFGTDPNKADSDDDGYDDREELQAGYNPNGEGKTGN